MVLTVKDLITTSNIHDLKVICGKEEMNREIIMNKDYRSRKY